MRIISQRQSLFEIAVAIGILVAGLLAVGKSEAQEIFLQNPDVVLLDCVEDANAFTVENISSTRDLGINQGQSCATAVQKLFGTGFLLWPGMGGVASAEPGALNHFMMLFVLNSQSLIEQRTANPLLNPPGNCGFGLNFRDCPPELERQEQRGPTPNRLEPKVPTPNRSEPLPPIIQRRTP